MIQNTPSIFALFATVVTVACAWHMGAAGARRLVRYAATRRQRAVLHAAAVLELEADDRTYIAAAVTRALDGGAATPEALSKALYSQGCYVSYNRYDYAGIKGASYGRHGIPGRHRGADIGHPWQTVAERLRRNAGQ